jgi:hypothetical protein
MIDSLAFFIDSKGGTLIILFFILSGSLLGLFYRHKFFASKEFIELYTYSKSQVNKEIDKLKKELVPERILDIKLEAIHSKLASMDEKQEERHERLTESMSKLEVYIQTMTKNI